MLSTYVLDLSTNINSDRIEVLSDWLSATRTGGRGAGALYCIQGNHVEACHSCSEVLSRPKTRTSADSGSPNPWHALRHATVRLCSRDSAAETHALTMIIAESEYLIVHPECPLHAHFPDVNDGFVD
jgi:hypothetical protein